jgi:coenzyme F420-reducing hydrogenase beta subunit
MVLVARRTSLERGDRVPIKVFAFSHTASVVADSASGGAFYAIAEAFFDRFVNLEKYVHGVTFNEDMQVIYQSAKTLDQCRSFQGSKYVRADMTGTAEIIAQQLSEGAAVLFVGTPCFVYTLKDKLKRWKISTEYLLCVDLICHGTPERKYWDAYKQWLEMKNNSRLTQYKFRTHIPGKGPYTAVARFENGKKLIGTLEVAVFNRLFLRHYTLAEGCFYCRFANLNRQGDLTIGDFWGIEKVIPDFPKEKAVSEMLVNTEKGELISQWMCAQNRWDMKQCISDAYIQYQNNLQRPAARPDDLDSFKKSFQEKGMQYVARKYAGYNMFHRMKFRIQHK